MWTGKKLWDEYCKYDMQLNNCGNETWDTLDDDMRAVWVALAVEINVAA